MDNMNIKYNENFLFKNKKFKLCVGAVLAVTLSMSLTGCISESDYDEYNEEDEVVEEIEQHINTTCNFYNYENLDENLYVTFLRDENEFQAGVYVDSDGQGDSEVYLYPAHYKIVTSLGEVATEFDVDNDQNEYIVDIDCVTNEVSVTCTNVKVK